MYALPRTVLCLRDRDNCPRALWLRPQTELNAAKTAAGLPLAFSLYAAAAKANASSAEESQAPGVDVDDSDVEEGGNGGVASAAAKPASSPAPLPKASSPRKLPTVSPHSMAHGSPGKCGWHASLQLCLLAHVPLLHCVSSKFSPQMAQHW